MWRKHVTWPSPFSFFWFQDFCRGLWNKTKLLIVCPKSDQHSPVRPIKVFSDQNLEIVEGSKNSLRELCTCQNEGLKCAQGLLAWLPYVGSWRRFLGWIPCEHSFVERKGSRTRSTRFGQINLLSRLNALDPGFLFEKETCSPWRTDWLDGSLASELQIF